MTQPPRSTSSELRRRAVVLTAAALWFGGLTFYGSVVIEEAHTVLGTHLEVGFITRRVTRWLNLLGVLAIVAFLWELRATRGAHAKPRLRAVPVVFAILAQAVLFLWHGVIDDHLDPETIEISDYSSFYINHRVYLWASLVQWLAVAAFVWTTLRVWFASDHGRTLRGSPHATLGDRSWFSAVGYSSYFNHASMSPPSEMVVAATRSAVDDYRTRGAGAWVAWSEQRQRLREKIAQLIGAQPDEVGLVPNTSHGIIAVASSIVWQPGDRVVTFEGEFPANVTPWQQATARAGGEVVFVPFDDGAPSTEALLHGLELELQKGARLVAVSAVRFQSGFRMPVQRITEMAHAHGARVFVDAIQQAGAVPFDVHELGIDYAAAGGHKWLMGTDGAGFVWARPEHLAEFQPVVASWLSHEDAATFLFEGAGHLRHDRPLRKTADVFELGVMNSSSFAALEAGVDSLLKIGPAAIFVHVQKILDELEQGLVERGFRSARPASRAERSCILSVLPPDGVDLAELWAQLDAAGVSCATPDGWLRFSPHWPNSAEQVSHVLAAIDAAQNA